MGRRTGQQKATIEQPMPRLSTHIHPTAARIAAETVLAITPKLNALEPSVHDDRAAMIAYQNPFAWEASAFVPTLTVEVAHVLVP